MINGIQKMMYRLGIISPIVIISILIRAYRIHKITNKMWIVLGGGIICLLYHLFFIKLVSIKIPAMDFVPSTTPQEDDLTLLEITVTYVIPFGEWLFDIYVKELPSCVVPGILCLGLLIILSLMNNTVPSPTYWLMGYHYHTIESAGKKYRIMARRKSFRNSRKVKRVQRIFEDMLLLVL